MRTEDGAEEDETTSTVPSFDRAASPLSPMLAPGDGINDEVGCCGVGSRPGVEEKVAHSKRKQPPRHPTTAAAAVAEAEEGAVVDGGWVG